MQTTNYFFTDSNRKNTIKFKNILDKLILIKIFKDYFCKISCADIFSINNAIKKI